MPRGERDESAYRPDNQDLAPFQLPPELAAFLREQEYAMVTESSTEGTVFVVKAPAADIASIAGNVPMKVTHELHQHPAAPVIRTIVRIYDQPDRPLGLESFINVEDENQWAEYAGLADQEEFLFLFYDESLSHRLTKRVANSASEQMGRILTYADRIKAAIPGSEYDFDAAKADVMRSTQL